MKTDGLIRVFSNFGSENDTLAITRYKNKITWSSGCFTGTLEEFEDKIKQKQDSDQSRKEYLNLIKFIKDTYLD